ncbi:Hypothetical predicted protein [Pelobates cultripes]|uniref:Uncharacterized protein n=1 Tax=Pelobates cultripes TaxID=61616 RepID=A0AAD1VNZ8_PELCU|nr:Hypothetical predicted protein [Pelobates cultripes]
MARLLAPSDYPMWFHLESAFSAPLSLGDLLWTTTKAQPQYPKLLSTSRGSLQVWLRWAPKMTGGNIEALAPLTTLQHHTHDLPLQGWIGQGVTRISHLLGIDGLLPFPDLQKKYLIPNKEIFTYIRIKHIIGDVKKLTMLTQPHNCFDTMCLGQKKTKKPLSLCYHRLLDLDRPTKQSYMLQWERELNSTFEPHRWMRAMSLVKKATHCLDHVEAAYKLWLRWYYTPQRLAEIYPGSRATCWRCNQQEGTLSHIFWYCPALSQYWQQIQDLIKLRVGIDLPPAPEHYLLHMMPPEITAHEASLITHITLAAKQRIAALWKSTLAPDIQSVITKVNLTQQYEEMSHTISGTLLKYKGIWSKW